MVQNGCLLCIPLVGQSLEEMLSQMEQARIHGADCVELRIDHLRNFNPRVDLDTLLKARTKPAIITYRLYLIGFAPLHRWNLMQVYSLICHEGFQVHDLELSFIFNLWSLLAFYTNNAWCTILDYLTRFPDTSVCMCRHGFLFSKYLGIGLGNRIFKTRNLEIDIQKWRGRLGKREGGGNSVLASHFTFAFFIFRHFRFFFKEFLNATGPDCCSVGKFLTICMAKIWPTIPIWSGYVLQLYHDGASKRVPMFSKLPLVPIPLQCHYKYVMMCVEMVCSWWNTLIEVGWYLL